MRPIRMAFSAAGLLLAWCSLSGLADSFPISVVDNRVFVDATLNGRGPFALLLDTGSSSVTVERPAATLLRLPQIGTGSTEGAGENQVGYHTAHLDSVALGKFALPPMDVPVLDNTRLARAVGFVKFDGVLGADIFRKHVVTIDVPRSELTLQETADFHPARAASKISMELNGDEMPVVDATINGLRGRFIVDTGDRSSLTLFGPFWRKNHLDRGIGAPVTAMTGFGVGGPIRALVGRPGSFSLGDIALPAPVTRLSLQKAGVFTSGLYAGSIGMGVLKRFVVSFDYPHKNIWLEKDSAFNQPDLYDRSGVWLGFGDDGHLVVMDVTAGGPAAKSGLLAGDHILAVDDIPADDAHLPAIRSWLARPEAAKAEFHIRRGTAVRSLTLFLRDLIAPPY